MEVPLSNKTALQTEMYHGWMKVPRTRGTSNILYTCIFTIVLCVYTAIHINIPAPSESHWRQRLRLTKWTLLGILAPEVVLLAAWSQFTEARQLIRNIAELETNYPPGDPKVALLPSREGLHLSYGFYAVMGGFRVRWKKNSDQVIDAAMNPMAISYLAKRGISCRISAKTLQDRSKSDVLAKSLVIVQVIWMCAQCIARKATGLPLSLLEVHTVVHCVCAAFVYALWLQKPQNVGEATYVDIPEEHQPQFQKLISKSKYESVPRSEGKDADDDIPLASLGSRMNNVGNSASIVYPQRRNRLRQKFNEAFWAFSTTVLGRWSYRLAGCMMQSAYGGIHLAAWQAQFATNPELWMWRLSGIVIVVFMPLCLTCFLFLGKFLPLIDHLDTVSKSPKTTRFGKVLCIVTLCGLAFIFTAGLLILIMLFLIVIGARLFLIVESFISLRAVPIGIYAPIPWADYIPHL